MGGLCHADRREKKFKVSGNVGPIDPATMRQELIEQINELREIHQVSGLWESSELNAIAQSFSNQLVKKGNLEYSNNQYNGQDLGEILFYVSGDCSSDVIIDSWNEDEKKFKYKSKNPEASSFAQLVWKSSQYIGIGISKDNKGGHYIVANFYPVGNVQGQFQDNVFPAKGKSKGKKKKESNTQSTPQTSQSTSYGNPAQDYSGGYSSNPQPQQQGFSGYNNFCAEALQTHNYYRARHHAPPLRFNQELCNIAQAYAEKLAKKNSIAHSKAKFHGENMGENIFFCSNKTATGEMASTSWYDEIKKYNFKKDAQPGTGHFTQLVWKSTTDVGFGVVPMAGNYYVVANYYPCGNMIGKFHENVLKA